MTAEPRYLYFMSDAGRLASKAIIEPSSGQLRMTGYIPTGANNYSVFHCPTAQPTTFFMSERTSTVAGRFKPTIWIRQRAL